MSIYLLLPLKWSLHGTCIAFLPHLEGLLPVTTKIKCVFFKTLFSLLSVICYELSITRTPDNSIFFRFPLKVQVKPGSHMPPMYLRSSRWYHLDYFSDEWEHAPPATWAIAELYRRHACKVELESTSQACRWWRLGWAMLPATSVLISEQYPGSTGGHVAGASAAYEKQALSGVDCSCISLSKKLKWHT